MAGLCSLKCKPCNAETPALSCGEIEKFLYSLPAWSSTLGSTYERKIYREFKFKDFSEALAFVNAVGEVAEQEGHHPDILIYQWRKVRLELTTHVIHGLSENDFILGAKIDVVHKKLYQ